MTISLIVATILVLWFRSEAYVEYCRLLHLNWISFYKDYYDQRKNDVSLNYFGYLRQYHNCFFVRLITCPVCVGTWLALGLTLLTLDWVTFPIAFIGGLILFGTVDRLLG